MTKKVSTLYNIEPINKNTPFIESLSSYIERIAASHNITTGTLMSKLITPIINKTYLNNINVKGGDGFYKSSNAIDGTGTIAISFISALETLTQRDDLPGTTLIRLGPILANRGLLRSKKAWCPVCIESMRKSDTEKVYRPLLWSIALFSVCPSHNIKLETLCPNCKVEMNVLSRKSVPGYCTKCLTWLGSGKQQSDKEEKLPDKEFEQKNSRFIVELLNIGLEENKTPYKSEDVTKAIKEIVYQLFDKNVKKTAYMLGFPYTTFRYWYEGINLPAIESIAKICIVLDTTLRGFLKGSVLKSELVNVESRSRDQQVNTKYDHQYIKNILQRTIDEEFIISIKNLSHLIGCDRTLLTKKYPEKCELIIKNNKTFMSLQKGYRLSEKYKELDQLFFETIKKGLLPSVRRLEKSLGSNVLKEKTLKNRLDHLRQLYL